MGNITGAMVFQSCIPVSIGIICTSWVLDQKILISALLAVLSAALTYASLKIRGKLTAVPLITGGLFYAAFIVYLILTGFK
jgi:cation:H+ antiporter